ncbi:MAG: flavodoxin family protein [Candidatus Hermodarchaeota archaeon]
MKILITYFSNTGNTEKVAKSMKEGLTDYDVDLLPVIEVDPTTLSSYNIVFIGSGVYASRIDKSVLNLIKKAAPHLPTKLVYFCTHASLNMYQDAFNKVNTLIQDYNCEIVGEFDCVGENLGIPEETQLAMLEKLPDEQKEKALKIRDENRGRPNETDLNNAKNYALSLVKNL